MLVNCQDIKGEKIDRDTAYKVVIVDKHGKKHNKYFSSEEGYKQFELDKQYREKILNLITDYLGSKVKLPTLVYKNIEEYRKQKLGLDVLYNTLVSCRSDIEWSMKNKDFGGSMISKIQYMFKILDNHCMEEYRKKVAYQRIQKQQSDDPNEMRTLEGERRQAVRNLSQFLDD